MARTKETTIKEMKETIKEVWGKELQFDLDNISVNRLIEIHEVAMCIYRKQRELSILIQEHELGIR